MRRKMNNLLGFFVTWTILFENIHPVTQNPNRMFFIYPDFFFFSFFTWKIKERHRLS